MSVLRSPLAIFTALAVLLHPLTASTDEYIFRYKHGANFSSNPPEEPPPEPNAPISVSFSGGTYRSGDSVHLPVSISGGAGGYQVSISGAPWLSWDASQSAIQGNANTGSAPSYEWAVGVDVTDADLDQASANAVVAVYPELAASAPSSADGTVGEHFALYPWVVGAVGLQNWTLASGSLPEGLSIDHETGAITGTPSVASNSSISLRAVDTVDGETATTSPISLAIDGPLMASFTGGQFRQSDSISRPISITGGSAPYSVQLSGVPGLVYDDATTRISGTASPGNPPTYERTLTATITDAKSRSTSAEGNFVIYPNMTASLANPAQLSVGVPASVIPTATGIVGTASWSIASGSLAGIPGLSLNTTTGAITGTPTAAGSVTISLRVTDSIDSRSATTETRTINAVVIERLVTLTSRTNVSLSSLFSASDWSSSHIVKRAVIPAGVTIGSTSAATPALRTGTGLAGTLRIENNGSIEGAGGSPNGGVGGDAFRSDVASGVALVNSGSIRSGGGGGGRGGQGGPGDPTVWQYDAAHGCFMATQNRVRMRWNGVDVATVATLEHTVGNVRYTCPWMPEDWSPHITIGRTILTDPPVPGGTGGNGGRGTGYQQTATPGLDDGGPRANDTAGWGGPGGNGGAFGTSGQPGVTGASGSRGSGLAGQGGGLAGYAVAGSVTYSGSGVRQGR